MAPVEKVKKPATAGKKKSRHPLNSYIGAGIMRYSKSKMFKRRALYRLKGVKRPIFSKAKIPLTKEKKINGPKNGGTRTVIIKKAKYLYPTTKRVHKRKARGTFSRHVRNIRKAIQPGRILILLAGHHQGKRVVCLKTLSTGLILVTGPFGVNSCPLRRVSQRYLIATRTKIDLGDFKVPEHINDKYFNRKTEKKSKKPVEGDIFAAKKEKFVPNEQRKKDQKEVDAAVIKAIRAHPEAKYIKKYLKSMFSLSSSQYPHRMKF